MKDASRKRLCGAFPQARLLALAECGTRALIAAACGAYRTGEKTLTAGLPPRLGPGMLVLADRNFAGYQLWCDAAATGAELLWRIGASFTLPPEEVLEDGTYLSRLQAPRHLRKAGPADITVRVIEYRLEDAGGQVTETFTFSCGPRPRRRRAGDLGAAAPITPGKQGRLDQRPPGIGQVSGIWPWHMADD